MQIIIYFTSAILTNIVFSVVTSILITYGFDKMGSDPGSPGIMLISLMCICGILGGISAAAMETLKAKYQKGFPARFSAIIFLVTYLPFHITGLYFSDQQLAFLGFMTAPLAILSVIMLYFSYIPLFHMTAQGLINVNEFVNRQAITGKQYPKFIFLAFLAILLLLPGWYIYRILF